jgi:hypothetical protein
MKTPNDATRWAFLEGLESEIVIPMDLFERFHPTTASSFRPSATLGANAPECRRVPAQQIRSVRQESSPPQFFIAARWTPHRAFRFPRLAPPPLMSASKAPEAPPAGMVMLRRVQPGYEIEQNTPPNGGKSIMRPTSGKGSYVNPQPYQFKDLWPYFALKPCGKSE